MKEVKLRGFSLRLMVAFDPVLVKRPTTQLLPPLVNL